MTEDDTSADVAALLDRVSRQAEDVLRAQRDVAALSVIGTSGDGDVTVTVRGTGRFTDVRIDPAALRRHDARGLGEVVLEAVNDGLRRLADASAARFASITEPFDDAE